MFSRSSLLTPILQEVVTLQGAESPCGMSCCKSGKNSSYCGRHRAKQSAPGVHWTSGDQCPKDCGQFSALPNPPGMSPANSTLSACPVVPASTHGQPIARRAQGFRCQLCTLSKTPSYPAVAPTFDPAVLKTIGRDHFDTAILEERYVPVAGRVVCRRAGIDPIRQHKRSSCRTPLAPWCKAQK